MLHLTALLAGLLLSAPPSPSPQVKTMPTGFPFTWNTSEEWRRETIPFPLDFAPSLKYKGVEEIRFAPGFGKPDKRDYFTYAFVWVIEADEVPSAEQLAQDLEVYFDGLMTEVGRSKDKSWPAVTSKVVLKKILKRDLPKPLDDGTLEVYPYAAGNANTIDAFYTKKPLALKVGVYRILPPLAYRQALYFELSPEIETNSPELHHDVRAKLKR
jgi:hypothetical protein